MTKSTVKRSRKALSIFVRLFLDKQWNVFKIVDIRDINMNVTERFFLKIRNRDR